jgi:hypothetical protein
MRILKYLIKIQCILGVRIGNLTIAWLCTYAIKIIIWKRKINITKRCSNCVIPENVKLQYFPKTVSE